MKCLKGSIGILFFYFIISFYVIESKNISIFDSISKPLEQIIKKTNNKDQEGNTSKENNKKHLKPVPNIHLMSIKFLVSLFKKLDDMRADKVISSLLIKNYPNINIFTIMRRDVINCQKLSNALHNSKNENEKIVALGCTKSIIDHIYHSCKNVLRSSPAHKIIKKALYNLSHIKKENLVKFQVQGKIFLKRLIGMLRKKSSNQNKMLKKLSNTDKNQIKKSQPSRKEKIIVEKSSTNPPTYNLDKINEVSVDTKKKLSVEKKKVSVDTKKVKLEVPSKEEVKLTGNNKEEVKLTGNNKKEVKLTGNNKEEVKLTGKKKEEVKLPGNNKEEVKLTGKKKEEVKLTGHIKKEVVNIKKKVIVAANTKKEEKLVKKLKLEKVKPVLSALVANLIKRISKIQ